MFRFFLSGNLLTEGRVGTGNDSPFNDELSLTLEGVVDKEGTFPRILCLSLRVFALEFLFEASSKSKRKYDYKYEVFNASLNN